MISRSPQNVPELTQSNNKRIYWNSILGILFAYRCLMSVAAQTFIIKFTRLGDSGSWQRAEFFTDIGWHNDSNAVVANIGAVFYYVSFGSPIIINLGFQTLAFYGLYRLLIALEPAHRNRLVLLLFLPSFTIWTSIAGKEAVLVFAVSTICAYFVDLYYGRERFGIIHLVSIYFIFTIKYHYLIPLFYFFGTSKICRHVKQPALLALIGGIISLFPLYLFRDAINRLSFDMLPHFVGFGRSTRDAFWIENFDVFWKAPLGMYQGFFGPTLHEALVGQNLLHIFTYLEELFLLIVFSYMILINFRKLPIYNFIIAIFSIFWMLFPNYPFGIMNPGSAIRYRSGYIVFIFFIISVLMSKELFVTWRMNRGPLFGRARRWGGGILALTSTFPGMAKRLPRRAATRRNSNIPEDA